MKEFTLIKFSSDFAAELFSLIQKNKAYLSAWLPWVEATKSPKDCQKFIEITLKDEALGNSQNRFIFCDEQIIGTISLRNLKSASADFGYWISEDYSRQGIIKASVKKLMQENQKVNTFIIRCRPTNIASASVASACGFKFKETLVNQEKMNNKSYDLDVYIWQRSA